MEDNNTSSFPSLLYTYTKKLDPVAKLISRINPPQKISNENTEETFFLFTICFKGAFESDAAFDAVESIVLDDTISDHQLDKHLNICLSNIVNDTQKLAIKIALSNFRELLYDYLNPMKDALLISQRFELVGENYLSPRGFMKKADYNFISEKTHSILLFTRKIFNIFEVANNYWLSLGNEEKVNESVLSVFPKDAVAQDKRKNRFNRMLLPDVEKWFIQLVNNNSKNGSPFLDLDQLRQFIDRAFCGKPFTEKLSMNEKAGDKGNVIGLFHLYYNHCITHKPKTGKLDPDATSEKYIKLLTENFDNWSFDEIKNNFRSGGNWGEQPY